MGTFLWHYCVYEYVLVCIAWCLGDIVAPYYYFQSVDSLLLLSA